jgi:hypothetical protein
MYKDNNNIEFNKCIRIYNEKKSGIIGLRIL